jgi:D-cysteine desulfhydrase
MIDFEPPRHRLAFLPTPIVELPRLAAALGGPRIWIKRDDQTGLALGGNKTRKLEYLVGDALARGADTLITAGAAQSNHCRQTAAAAAACGLDCHLVLGGSAPDVPEGNLLLDRLFGAEIHWGGPHRKGEDLPRIADELRADGRCPYAVPYGGSNGVGAMGFFEAARELREQMGDQGLDFTHAVFASSSGGTHGGLLAGMRYHGLALEPLGIRVDKEETAEPFARIVARLASTVAASVGLEEPFDDGSLGLIEDYSGTYGQLGPMEREAIRITAKTEGILLDPVYTGRAMAALIDMIRRGRFMDTDRILFWHTGGAPALFACADSLLVE